MSRLIKIAGWSGNKRGNVVFIHGLGGHPYDTWRHSSDLDQFWPVWLAQELKGLNVFSLGYISPPTGWLGTAMPLLDESAGLLRILLASPELQTGPIAFICHSLGGLIVKNILRSANEQHNDAAAMNLLERTRQVVFLATPHTGSEKATLLRRIAFLAWPSQSTSDLVANSSELRSLNFAYRALAEQRGNRLSHLVFYEMIDTAAGRIVTPPSADPGLPKCRPIPVREDHISIVKPVRRDSLVYLETKALLCRLGPEPIEAGTLEIYSLEPFKSEESWHRLIPKLVRLAAVLIVIALLMYILWPRPPKPYAGVIFQEDKPLLDTRVSLRGTPCSTITVDNGYFQFDDCEEAARLTDPQAIVTLNGSSSPCPNPFPLLTPPRVVEIRIDAACKLVRISPAAPLLPPKPEPGPGPVTPRERWSSLSLLQGCWTLGHDGPAQRYDEAGNVADRGATKSAHLCFDAHGHGDRTSQQLFAWGTAECHAPIAVTLDDVGQLVIHQPQVDCSDGSLWLARRMICVRRTDEIADCSDKNIYGEYTFEFQRRP